MPGLATGGGTGAALGSAAVIVCGVASLIASVISFVSIWLQLKNYRKPLLQRYVVRILFMVPIYATASWASLMSQDAAFYLDPLRDVYEAFTIYTFFQLLINFLGGERSLIIMTHGRQPIDHFWPLNNCLPKVDISDPHTFLAIKRGILQYAWLKPLLAVATILLKLTGTYKEGYLGLTSGYLWVGIIYNLSITISLYTLALFWACMHKDLTPFRPIPKFLCIKLIIFASYWQGFGLSILQKLGAITNKVPGYSADNLAAAIQDALICCEMPIFAISHWYAFSWHDYADVTISAARMPVKYAIRDAFGPQDLIQDTKETFGGRQYEYRSFDSGDNVIAHEESGSRTARMMEGMRYERSGQRKYWIPKPGEINSKTPLLAAEALQQGSSSESATSGFNAESSKYGTESESQSIDVEDERLFEDAKALEFGDWNYPVITAHVPATDRWYRSEPSIVTTTTHRHILQPTAANKKRRLDKTKERLRQDDRSETPRDGKKRGSSAEDSRSKPSRTSIPGNSGPSQLVDLVVEDEVAEETERVRARKDGGPAWNEDEARHFVQTYGEGSIGKRERKGFEPQDVDVGKPPV